MQDTLKHALKRGALIAAANWPVVVVQEIADSLFKLLLAMPLIGGIFLVALVLGAEPVALLSQFGVAGVLETFGGLLLLLGLFTRPVAFVLAGEMAVAYFMAHIGRSFFPVLNGGEPAVLFCFIWLFMAAAGPGAFSLDGRRTQAPPA